MPKLIWKIIILNQKTMQFLTSSNHVLTDIDVDKDVTSCHQWRGTYSTSPGSNVTTVGDVSYQSKEISMSNMFNVNTQFSS